MLHAALAFGQAQPTPLDETTSETPTPADVVPVDLEPLPEPDLTGMEPAVGELLAGERKALERLIERDDIETALLADAWGEMGFVYHAHGLLDAAATCYRNAGILTPEDFRWPHSLGALERERGHLEAAREALTRTLELAPKDLPAILYLGDVELALGRIEAATELTNRALEISDSSPAVLDLAGRVAMQLGQPEEALKLFDFARQQVPEANRLHYEIGMAHRELGDLEKAREHLAQAGKIGVKPPDRLLEMIDDQRTGERLLLLEGRRAYNAGDYAAAARAFQRAVDAEPESIRARVNLASALAYSGSEEQAVEELNQVLEQDPQHHEALFNLGAIYRASGHYSRAIDYLTKALQLDEQDDGVRYELGLAYRGQEDFETAAVHLGEAAATRALDSRVQHAYGDTLAALGRYEESLEVLKQAYQLMPEDGLLAHGLARLLAACPDPSIRNGQIAVDLATRVVQASPTAGHLETLAMALAESGRCTEAAQVQRQILDLPNVTPVGVARYSVVAQRYAAGPPCRPAVDPALAAEVSDSGSSPETDSETQSEPPSKETENR